MELVQHGFYSNMVWLSIIGVSSMCSYVNISVSIPIWSDYLYSSLYTQSAEWVSFYSNMVWLSIKRGKSNSIMVSRFLFQYGLIIYIIVYLMLFKKKMRFYSNMVWLSIYKLFDNTIGWYLFLFQYGLIIYLSCLISYNSSICVSIPIWSDYLYNQID